MWIIPGGNQWLFKSGAGSIDRFHWKFMAYRRPGRFIDDRRHNLIEFNKG